MTSQDIQIRLDLTGLIEVTASEINQVTDTAYPADDKGLRIVTTDTAVNTPDVPDPSITLEGVTVEYWIRYKWVRNPHASDIGTRVKEYNWNPNIASDPTLLKWEYSNTIAELALTTAEGAEANATEATNAAAEAITVASNALSAATAAAANADAANVIAETAALKNVEQDARLDALETALEGDDIDDEETLPTSKGGTGATTVAGARTNLGLEYAPRGFCFIQDRKDAGTNGQALTLNTWTKRVLNLVNPIGEGSRVSITAGNNIVLDPGTYLIEAEAPAYGVTYHQIRIYNETSGTTLGYGSSEYAYNGAEIGQTRSKAVTTISVTAATEISIHHNVGATGIGGAANSFGGNEIYTQVKITVMR